MEGRNDILDWLALRALPGLGCVLVRRLLAAFGTPDKVLAAGKAVAEVQGVGRNIATLLSSSSHLDKARFWAEKEYARVQTENIQLLCCEDPCYPSLLLNLHDYPILLYCKGNLDDLTWPAVAIVGSRTPTEYGAGVSSSLAGQLVGKGFAVVSGMARGIDGQAHIGALEAGGRTIAVLGCGVDVVYPGEHRVLHGQIEKDGLLLSEYPLGTPPYKSHFPARNRLVSGLCLGVVIVEAASRSGALITARQALEQNREVFAVPGRIDSPQSEGTLQLLRQGATLVRSVDDILVELPPLSYSGKVPPCPPDTEQCTTAPVVVKQKVQPVPDDLSLSEQQLLSCIQDIAIDIEELSELSTLPLNTLHAVLLGLELKGLIRQLPGQQYVRA
ncbi:MAG: DNA-processing protein DprA [Candidatus Electrothrix aestuarii]|uniref:DNA-processing protein DprA n=1 Tax=Candidatus Electrothrix aestuarii TaxID=3062594 RepID=A0AAU8LVB8_9BACT|nr:DNA-processing protein DprA [Candidatus Electrothrix aestuarii]